MVRYGRVWALLILYYVHGGPLGKSVSIGDAILLPGRPATKLVFIGRNMDEASIRAALDAACAPSESATASLLAIAETRALVQANPRIEMIPQSGHGATQVGDDGEVHGEEMAVVSTPPLAVLSCFPLPSIPWGPWVMQICTGSPHVIAFRLSGAATLGLTSEELQLKHGIDLDGMNKDLQRRVNQLGRRDGLLLRLVRVEDSEGGSMIGLCFAVGEQDVGYYREAWGMVEGVVAEVAQTHLGRLRLCKCGH